MKPKKYSISAIHQKKRRDYWLKILMASLMAIFFIVWGWGSYQSKEAKAEKISITTLQEHVNAGRVKSLSVIPGYLSQEYKIVLKTGEEFIVKGPHLERRDVEAFLLKGVNVEWLSADTDWRAFPSYLMTAILLILILSSLGQPFGFSLMKSSNKSSTTFKDVAGNEEAKSAIREVVEYLREPHIYEQMGARFPKGIIMDGPPGTGKTLLAKAVAGEAGAHFMAVSGSDFSSMFVGVSSMKVKGIFNKARKMAPCVLFIDEIDALGGHRLSEGTATAREMGSTLNSMLVMMDGFEDNNGVIVIAATNRLELLDPALLRSGRFDRHIHVQLPSLAEREEILKLHAKDIEAGVIDYEVVAKACAGMSGADLANVMNQAALIAVNKNLKSVDTACAIAARDRLILGDPRLSLAANMNPATKKLLAIHECGHAIVALSGSSENVTKVSILPRGNSLGQTMLAGHEDSLLATQEQLLNKVRLLLGGRAAEILVANTQTTGASDDLARSSRLCLDYVSKYGMRHSNLLNLSDQQSPQSRHHFEEEANRLMQTCLEDAKSAIKQHQRLFDEMVSLVLAQEELGPDQMAYFRNQIQPHSF